MGVLIDTSVVDMERRGRIPDALASVAPDEVVLLSVISASGPHHLWRAAQARARGFAIATANVREFARVPGLRVIG